MSKSNRNFLYAILFTTTIYSIKYWLGFEQMITIIIIAGFATWIEDKKQK